jgi:cytochrome P450
MKPRGADRSLTTLQARPVLTAGAAAAAAAAAAVCRLTDTQICDNILLLLFAGHDTSSTTLTHCFSNLQDHPAALQALREEQEAVVAKHGQQITAAALRDMHYAEAVIRWAP